MRKNHNVKKTMVITLVILFAGVGAAMAGFGGPGMMGPGGGVQWRALMELDLDDTQREEIGKLIKAHRQERQDSKDSIRELRGELRDMVRAQDFKESDFRTVFRQMAPLLEERAVARAKLAFGVKSILTPDQLQELQDSRKKHGNRRGYHRKGRDGALDEWIEKGAE